MRTLRIILTLLTALLLTLVSSPANAATAPRQGDHYDKCHGTQHIKPPHGKGKWEPIPDASPGTATEQLVVCGKTYTLEHTYNLEQRVTEKRNGDVITETRGSWSTDVTKSGRTVLNDLDNGGPVTFVDHPNGTSTVYVFAPAVVSPLNDTEADKFQRAGLPRDGLFIKHGVLIVEVESDTSVLLKFVQLPKKRYITSLCDLFKNHRPND